MNTLQEKLINISKELLNDLLLFVIAYLVAIASSWASYMVYYKIPWPTLIMIVLIPFSFAFPLVFPTMFVYRFFIEKNNTIKIVKIILLLIVFITSFVGYIHFQKLDDFHKEFSAYDRFKISRDIETINQLP